MRQLLFGRQLHVRQSYLLKQHHLVKQPPLIKQLHNLGQHYFVKQLHPVMQPLWLGTLILWGILIAFASVIFWGRCVLWGIFFWQDNLIRWYSNSKWFLSLAHGSSQACLWCLRLFLCLLNICSIIFVCLYTEWKLQLMFPCIIRLFFSLFLIYELLSAQNSEQALHVTIGV